MPLSAHPIPLRLALGLGTLLSIAWLVGCSPHCLPLEGSATEPGIVELELVEAYAIESVERIEPSGLVLVDGRLLAVSDDTDRAVFEIVRSGASARARRALEFMPPADASPGLDLEGIAAAPDGGLLLLSESQFRVVHVSRRGGRARWFTQSLRGAGTRAGLFGIPNAYLEGLATLPGQGLLLAAERQPRGLLELGPSLSADDAEAWVAEPNIYAMPPGRDPDFGDLATHGGRVFALARGAHLVTELVRTDAGWQETHPWSYRLTEREPRFAYSTMRYGRGEGLALDQHHVYVVLDNNGEASRANPAAHEPWLFVFRRP